MSSVRLEAVPHSVTDIPFQDASLDIWDKKYRLKSKSGEIIDATIDDTYKRVARALASRDKQRKTSLSGTSVSCGPCAVAPYRPVASPPTPVRWRTSRPPRPLTAPFRARSRTRWTVFLQRVHEAGLTLKAGCGIGYEFSTLRPRGAYVSGAGAHTSGPLSFMDIYDKMCFTVSSAGGRRGAQMATFESRHPGCSRVHPRQARRRSLRQFNLSLLITDGFMEAVNMMRTGRWCFRFSNKKSASRSRRSGQVSWRDWPYTKGYVTTTKGWWPVVSISTFAPGTCGT